MRRRCARSWRAKRRRRRSRGGRRETPKTPPDAGLGTREGGLGAKGAWVPPSLRSETGDGLWGSRRASDRLRASERPSSREIPFRARATNSRSRASKSSSRAHRSRAREIFPGISREQILFTCAPITCSRAVSLLAREQSLLARDRSLLAREQSLLAHDQSLLAREQSLLAHDQSLLAREQDHFSRDLDVLFLSVDFRSIVRNYRFRHSFIGVRSGSRTASAT